MRRATFERLNLKIYRSELFKQHFAQYCTFHLNLAVRNKLAFLHLI